MQASRTVRLASFTLAALVTLSIWSGLTELAAAPVSAALLARAAASAPG